MANPTVLRGVVHGKTIEVSDLPGFPEGQVVTVTVHPVANVIPLPTSGPLTGSEAESDIPSTPSNTRLRELAVKHPPAKEWFVAEEEDLF